MTSSATSSASALLLPSAAAAAAAPRRAASTSPSCTLLRRRSCLSPAVAISAAAAAAASTSAKDGGRAGEGARALWTGPASGAAAGVIIPSSLSACPERTVRLPPFRFPNSASSAAPTPPTLSSPASSSSSSSSPHRAPPCAGLAGRDLALSTHGTAAESETTSLAVAEDDVKDARAATSGACLLSASLSLSHSLRASSHIPRVVSRPDAAMRMEGSLWSARVKAASAPPRSPTRRHASPRL